MYIFKSNSLGGLDDKLSKPQNSLVSVTDASALRLSSSAFVPVQAALLAGATAPAGLALNGIVDPIVTAGLVSNVTLPLTTEFASEAANETSINPLVGALEAFSKNIQDGIISNNVNLVTVTTLSDAGAIQDIGGLKLPYDDLGVSNNPFLKPVKAPESAVSFSVTSPVSISTLTENDFASVSNPRNVAVVGDAGSIQQGVQSSINSGSNPLNLATTGVNLTSSSSTSNSVFSPAVKDINTGITVSSVAGASDILLYFKSGASLLLASDDLLGSALEELISANSGNATISADQTVAFATTISSFSSTLNNLAWFQMDGNTYVVESIEDSLISHQGGPLVRLAGLTQFTTESGELAFEALHLAG